MSAESYSHGAAVSSYPMSKVAKAAGPPGSQKVVDAAHHSAFGNLLQVIEKDFGIPGDEIPYWDPYGFMNTGLDGGIDLKKDLYRYWEPVFDEMNGMLRRDRRTNLGYAAEKTIEKTLGRSSFSIPIFFTPAVYKTSTEDTPLADMVPRVATQEDTIKVDEETDVGAAASYDFEGSSDNWPENDDTYANHSYDVISYGRQNEVSDFVQLAARGLRSTRALTEEAQVASIRQYEEAQLFIGKGGNIDASANDANGFDGLPDIVDTAGTQVTDQSGAAMTIADVREANRYLRRTARASRENIMHFTDHTTFESLKSDLTDFTRYDTPGDTLAFGFDAILIDNTPIMETHGTPDSDGSRMFYSLDMASLYMGMLQDVTMHPLARSTPSETFAVDAYGTLVGRSQKGIHIYDAVA